MRFNVLMAKRLDNGEIVEIDIPMVSESIVQIECFLEDLTDPTHSMVGIFPDPYDSQDPGLKKCACAMILFFIEAIEEKKTTRNKTVIPYDKDYELTLPERKHLWSTIDRCVTVCAETLSLFLHMKDKAIIEDKYKANTIVKDESSSVMSIYKQVIPYVRRIIINTLTQYPLTDDTISLIKTHLEFEY